MTLKEFKLVKNKQRPDFCYAYEKKTDDTKWSIFTMDGGKSFLASIDQKRLDGSFYSEFSETHPTVDQCLLAFQTFNP